MSQERQMAESVQRGKWIMAGHIFAAFWLLISDDKINNDFFSFFSLSTLKRVGVPSYSQVFVWYFFTSSLFFLFAILLSLPVP